MTMKHPVYKTELIIDRKKREAYLKFTTSAGAIKIPVQVPEFAKGLVGRELCEALITLKFGAALAINYMEDRENLHGSSYWDQFFPPGETYELDREALLDDVQRCVSG